MNIGVVGPFNPSFIKEYLYEDQDIPDIFQNATSVNIYVKGLIEAGHNVTVFTSFSKSDCLLGDKVEVYLVTGSKKIVKNRYINFLLRKIDLLLKGPTISEFSNNLIKSISNKIDNLDILHAEWNYEYALAAKHFENRLPIFCSVRDWCPYLLNLVKEKKDKNLIRFWKRKYRIFKEIMSDEKIIFIANSDYTYKSIKDAYPESKTYIIPNPLLKSNIVTERNIYPDSDIFISIANSLTNIRKNIIILLNAFHIYRKKYPDSKLVLIGNYSQEWQNDQEKQGLLDGVELKGYQKYNVIFGYIDQSSCLIHPSLEETFGNILLEGMCRRVPCIGGENSGAVPQVLGYGKYGILCDVTSVDSMVNAMEKIRDKDLYSRIINESTKYISETYADTIIAEKHLRLFNDALNKEINNNEKA